MADITGPVMGGGVLALIGAFLFAFFIFALAMYVYCAIVLMSIAKKTKTPNGWLGFIPIANIYLMTQIGKISPWFTAAILLPIIPFIGGLALLVIMVYMWWKIAEAVGKPGWWGILMAVPIVNLVIMGIMAWGK